MFLTVVSRHSWLNFIERYNEALAIAATFSPLWSEFWEIFEDIFSDPFSSYPHSRLLCSPMKLHLRSALVLILAVGVLGTLGAAFDIGLGDARLKIVPGIAYVHLFAIECMELVRLRVF